MQTTMRVIEYLEQGRRAYPFLLLLGLLLLLPGLNSLPPTDRDEARFAQASKQMLETGNYVDIRFQEEARYKKPIGIYWLQAASVKLCGQPLTTIWPYRLPSVCGILATLLLCCYFGRKWFSPRVGLLAGVLLAVALLLQVEARLAKTDASLLASLMLMQGALGMLYLERHKQRRGRWPLVLTFWVACGVGILIKGPPGPIIALATILSLALADRQLSLLRTIRPLTGLLILLAIVLPWFIAIQQATGGEFIRKAFYGDLLPKLLSGQESHGAPPGYYLLFFPLLFWPGSLLTVSFVPQLWRQRDDERIRFLFAWLIPAWLIFELVPTKLPHYVMPFFPAIALLTAVGLTSPSTADRWKLPRRLLSGLAALLWLLAALILGIGLPLLPVWFARLHPWQLLPLAGLLLVLLGAWQLRKNYPPEIVLGRFLLGSLLIFPIGFASILPSIDIAWPSRKVAEILTGQPPGKLISVGFNEPSLVFLNGTATKLSSVQSAAAQTADGDYAYLLLERREKPGFEALAPDRLEHWRLLGAFDSYNYSKGKPMRLELYAKP